MLTAAEIQKRVKSGQIVIDPWNEDQLNPNSYNLRLAACLLVYTPEMQLDLHKPTTPLSVTIPKEGYVLRPGHLYLGSTVEYTETHDLIPVIDGRSSVGRLGIWLHICAGFGDINYCGNWTLELACVVPVRIYANAQMCQIRYHVPDGDITKRYAGKYQGSRGVKVSRMDQERE